MTSAPPTKPDAPQALSACWLARREVVRIACTQLGVRDPKPYWADVLGPGWRGPYPRHWCGAFALWCLRQAGLTDWRWTVGKGFLGDERGRWRLATTKRPEPGDIGYIDKPFQHYFIVAEADAKEAASIDGNQGAAPGVVQERRRKLAAATYFSIAKLLPSTPAPPPVNVV